VSDETKSASEQRREFEDAIIKLMQASRKRGRKDNEKTLHAEARAMVQVMILYPPYADFLKLHFQQEAHE